MNPYREDPCTECNGYRTLVDYCMGERDEVECRHCKGTGNEPRGPLAPPTGSTRT